MVFEPRRPPAFQLYARDFLADPARMLMDWDAQGMHVHLMCIAWLEQPPCTVSADDATLRRLCGNPPQDVWSRVKPQIVHAWVTEGDRLKHPGLFANFEEMRAFRESRRQNATAGWRKRKSLNESARASNVHRTSNDLRSATASSSASTRARSAREFFVHGPTMVGTDDEDRAQRHQEFEALIGRIVDAMPFSERCEAETRVKADHAQRFKHAPPMTPEQIRAAIAAEISDIHRGPDALDALLNRYLAAEVAA